MSDSSTPTQLGWLPTIRLQELLELLLSQGYQIIAPTLDQEAIVYGEIRHVDDLPRGWTDEQEAGKYRLLRREDDAYFGYVVGPYSWKRNFFPPHTLLQEAKLTDQGWEFNTPPDNSPPLALLGVRACELAAIAVQDKVFLESAYPDPLYSERRKKALIIAVNCTQAAPTCFCTSMKTGPECHTGFDLALTETAGGFLIETGSSRGEELYRLLLPPPATTQQQEQAQQARSRAAEQITRRMNTEGLRDLLAANQEHPRWDQVAERCLSCANCTMVCPTCFCHSVNEVSDLEGETVRRERTWDSCFQLEFSYMNGGVVRNDIRSRYRQWLSHKLGWWHDQFGTSGCVGCGRCITWCPVAIDLTEEVSALRGEKT